MKKVIIISTILGLFFFSGCSEADEELKLVKQQEHFNIILCFPEGYNSKWLNKLLGDLALPYDYENSEFGYIPSIDLKISSDSTLHILFDSELEKLRDDENFFNVKSVTENMKQYFADEQRYKMLKLSNLEKINKFADNVFILDENQRFESKEKFNYGYFTDVKSLRDSISALIESRSGSVAGLCIQVVVYNNQNLTQKGYSELNILKIQQSDETNNISVLEQENKYSTDSTVINNYKVTVDDRNIDKSAEKSSTALSSDININQKQKAKQSNYSIPKFEGQVFKKDFILIKK